MARAVARDLDAHVPSCPEWNVAKLTIHTGGHHRWVADAIRKGGEEPERPGKPGLRDDALVDWYRAGWRELADLLDATEDGTVAWSWSGDNTVGFWRRRTTLETLVHRWDAENATGEPSPLDAELSADGIDELLFVMVDDDYPEYSGESVRVTIDPADSPLSWTLRLEEGKRPIRERGIHDAGDGVATVALTGTAESLLLLLWGRYGIHNVDVEGEKASIETFVRWLKD